MSAGEYHQALERLYGPALPSPYRRPRRPGERLRASVVAVLELVGYGEEHGSMTDKKDKAEGVRKATLSATQTARQLGVAEAELAVYALQGRLETWGGGEDERYTVESVLRLSAEDLLRGILQRAESRCPDLCLDVEKLAGVQFARGQLSAHAEVIHDTGIPFRRQSA